MKKKKVFVHIGYEKTGTTTLQKHYLPHIEGVFYLGRHYAPEGGIKFSGYEEVLGAGDRLFDDEFVEGVREKFSESLFWENSSSEIFLLSNELFTGRFVHPASMNDLHRSVTSPNKVIELLQKLFSEEFFDLYFIITIRRQYDILASRYAQSYQYFRKEFRECLFFRSFEEFKEDFFSDPENLFRLSYNFLRTADSFAEVLGKDRILVLPFELLKENHALFLKSFCDFLGVNGEKLYDKKVPKENVRLAKDGTRRFDKISVFEELLEVKNKIIPNVHFGFGESEFSQILRKIHVPFQSNPGPIKFSDEEKERIKEIYFLSNKTLSQKYSLKLKEYEYF